MGEIHTEVAVVGAGPAGIAAAATAAGHGKRVVLIDGAARLGGQIWRHRSPAELPARGRRWLACLEASGAEVLANTIVVDAGPDHCLTAEREGRALRIRAERLVIATGAYERFLPFPGWTAPGVFGVGGIQALLKAGGSVAGKRIVLAGSGPLLLPVAAALVRGGARLVVVAEQAPLRRVMGFAASLWSTPGRLAQAAAYRRAFMATRYRCGAWVRRVVRESGTLEVTLTDGGREWSERCDLLGVGFGLVPSTELARLAGCRILDERVDVTADQMTSVRNVYCAGEPTGIAGADAAIEQGIRAGHAAGGAPRAARRRPDGFAGRLADAFALRGELRTLPDAETIICRCEDVRFGQLAPGGSARQVKLETRAGMGPCQGRVCGPAIRYLIGTGSDQVQSPLFPCLVSTLAGAGCRPDVPNGEP